MVALLPAGCSCGLLFAGGEGLLVVEGAGVLLGGSAEPLFGNGCPLPKHLK